MSAGSPLPCRVCSGPSRVRYRWRGFGVGRCDWCGTEAAAPAPSRAELEAFYQGFNSPAMERWQTRLELVSAAVDGYLESFARVTGRARPDSFLDLGGGVGYYAHGFQRRGVRSCVMDYGADALAFARDTLGVAWTVRGDIRRCADSLPHRSFDLVLARHSVEHVPDPFGFVADIARLLRPGGALQIETPNVESWEQLCHPAIIAVNYRILRSSNSSMPARSAIRHAVCKSMSGVNPPKHLWGFTPRAMRILLEAAGLEVREMRCEPAGHPVFDPLYYDVNGLWARTGLGIPYYYFERACSWLMRGRGTNLAALAIAGPER